MNRVRTVSAKGSHKDNNGIMVLSPFIGLGGKSFSNAGFSIGDKVEIFSKYGLVTVKLLKVCENQREDLSL